MAWGEASSARASAWTAAPLSSTVEVGDAAPDFTLANESGIDVPLVALRGAPVVVMFARASAHHALAGGLAAARRQLAAHGAVALMIVAGDREVALEVAAATGRELVVLSDPDGAVHRAFGVVEALSRGSRVASFVIDGNGDLAAVDIVRDAATAVELAIDALDLAR